MFSDHSINVLKKVTLYVEFLKFSPNDIFNYLQGISTRLSCQYRNAARPKSHFRLHIHLPPQPYFKVPLFLNSTFWLIIQLKFELWNIYWQSLSLS